MGRGFESLLTRFTYLNGYGMVGIAQLVSASDCGSEGRGFESHYPPFLLQCRMLGYRQGVRHRTLTPTFAGSNPASPVTGSTTGAMLLFVYLQARHMESYKPLHSCLHESVAVCSFLYMWRQPHNEPAQQARNAWLVGIHTFTRACTKV